jgi:hypothetical protein
MDYAGDVRIDRRRGNGVHLFRGCVLDLQYRFDPRISGSRPGLTPMEFKMLCLEGGIGVAGS